MSRLERNRLKRQRQREKIFFLMGLLLCIFVLVGGVLITNDIMVRITALPEEEDMFSMHWVSRHIDYFMNTVIDRFTRMGHKIAQLYDYVVQWIRN